MRRSSPLKDSILDLFDDDILKNNLSSPPAADSMEGDTEHAVEESHGWLVRFLTHEEDYFFVRREEEEESSDGEEIEAEANGGKSQMDCEG